MNELENCQICPRNCGVNRYKQSGFCQASAEIKIAKAFLHQWEEPCLAGERGSGTVFFSHCNMHCVFCQNYEISQGGIGKVVSIKRLAEIFLELQEQGAHNINLVTPTPYIPQVREALLQAKKDGLTVPVVYNSNAYEKIEALKSLEGLINVYLPDLKYYDDNYSRKYSQAPRYFPNATQAILEMYRQVGEPVFDQNNLLIKGLMIRHLMLPGLLFDAKKIVDWVLANLPKGVYFNLMCQYTPLYRAKSYPELNKKVKSEHYEGLLNYALANGLENGYFQDAESASDNFVPVFDLQGV